MLAVYRVENISYDKVTVLTTTLGRAIELSGFHPDDIRGARHVVDVSHVDGIVAAETLDGVTDTAVALKE